jgi:hypothetical protein
VSPWVCLNLIATGVNYLQIWWFNYNYYFSFRTNLRVKGKMKKKEEEFCISDIFLSLKIKIIYKIIKYWVIMTLLAYLKYHIEDDFSHIFKNQLSKFVSEK